MPKFHLDRSTRLNVERYLRYLRRNNKNVPEWQSYEASEDDPRPIADPKLEYDADRSGMIHVRKHTSETQTLPGYGTTDFGVSPFERESKFPLDSTADNIALGASVATIGYLLLKYRDRLSARMGTLYNYALLLRESSRAA